MAAVQLFDAVSYRIGRKVVCWKCLTRHERFSLTEDQLCVFNMDDVPTGWYACDRCKTPRPTLQKVYDAVYRNLARRRKRLEPSIGFFPDMVIVPRTNRKKEWEKP